MNSTSFDVATLLDANALGTLGTDLFIGEWFADADKQTLCLEGVGTPVDLKELYEQPNVQIFVRGDKREADHDVYLRAKAISDFLLSQNDCVTINGVGYKGFEEASNIAQLGKDDNELFIYSMNFMTFRNRT